MFQYNEGRKIIKIGNDLDLLQRVKERFDLDGEIVLQKYNDSWGEWVDVSCPEICYPGPGGFHLFFTAKFCDANRFYYFCYRHEAVRALKASGRDRLESHFHACSALDSCQRFHFLLTNHKGGSNLQFVDRFNHITRRAIKNILQSETTVKKLMA